MSILTVTPFDPARAEEALRTPRTAEEKARAELGLAPYASLMRRVKQTADTDEPARAAPCPIPIDKGIPMPPALPAGRPGARYPWVQMQAGDSFLYPPGTKKKTAQSTAYVVGKKLGFSFVVRDTSEGLRCWRSA
jgi:hypothetical protein